MNTVPTESLSAPCAEARDLSASRFKFFRRPLLRRISPRLFLAAVACLIGASSSSSAAPLPPVGPTPVAVTGMASPAGGEYTSFFNSMLNASGQVAFTTSITGGSNRYGLFAGVPGSLQTVVLANTPAPAGGNYTATTTIDAFNAAGQVAFDIPLSGGSSDFGSFAGGIGSIQAVALRATAAPAGGNYSGFYPLRLNDAGQVAFYSTLTGGSSASGIFAGLPGSLQTVALAGTAAPAGGNYSTLDVVPTFNSAGQVAFIASLTGGSSSIGLFAGAPGLVQAVALGGTPAPAGGNISNFGTTDSAINNAGQVAFVANLTGGTSTQGLFTGTPGSLQTVALQGTAAPAGGNYSTMTTPVINSSGQVAFRANLTGGSSAQGIFVGTPGSLQTIALSGTPSPDGVNNFDGLNSGIAFNASGQVAFRSTLSGPGVTTENDSALYAGWAGNLVQIVREGDILDVDPGPGVNLRTVMTFGFNSGSGGEDGKPMGLNDDGLLVYRLTFTDNSGGIFTSQIAAVPEPGTLGLLGFGSVVVLWKWRRRRG